LNYVYGVLHFALVLNEVLNAWIVGVEVVGVFIALTTKTTVGGGCCRWAHQTVRCATGLCPVRQPHHPTVRVRAQTTVGALSSSGTGESGAAPDSPVRL
jgi:hypothetical protein